MGAGLTLGRDFGAEHFGSARPGGGDARRTRRLVRAARPMTENPDGTPPRRVRGHAELVGLYRLTG